MWWSRDKSRETTTPITVTTILPTVPASHVVNCHRLRWGHVIRLWFLVTRLLQDAVVKIRTTSSTENKQIMFMIVSTSLHNKTFALQIYIESNNYYSVIMNHNFIILNIKCMTPSSSSILHKLVVISFSSFSYNRIINYVSMCMFFLVWS